MKSRIDKIDEKNKEILHKVLSGDNYAMTLFIKNNNDLIYKFLLKKVKNEQLAEDLTQDTLVRLYKSIFSFNLTNVKTTTFILKIAENIYYDSLRRNGVEDNFIKNELISEFLPSEEDSYIEKEKNQKLINVLKSNINQLKNDDMKNVLKLKLLEDMTNKEISEFTGLQENNVKTLISRGLVIIQKINKDNNVTYFNIFR